MSSGDALYLAVYVASLASVGAIFASVYVHSRRASTSLDPRNLLALTREETSRLSSGDAVFLMHVSIALGVGLSIILSVFDPILGVAPVIREVLLVVSLPVVLGLLAAFVWRIERFSQSKKVESELKTGPKFASSSSFLQGILMLAIALTTSELVFNWFSGFATPANLIGIGRNALVVLYYSRPTVNLIGNFSRPLPSMTVPFLLADVLSGKTDPAGVKVGVSALSEFAPFERLSYDSCVEIGACEAACPATAAGRPLSPRVLVRKLSLSLEKGGGSNPFDSVGEDELWSCTSCGACVSSCPVSVKHLDIIYDLRRELVSRGKLDKEKSAMLENLTREGNPYGLKSDARGEWAEGLGVDTLSSNSNPEYVYWVGCVASYDQRAQKVASSLSKIMKKAGISFAIMADEESCTGDPARRLGEEGRYQELAYSNIEKLNSKGVKKVVASCPHCYNALKNEYPTFGGNFEVVYHTQLISDLIREGKIKVPPDRVSQVSVTLHDACYAARYNNVFDEPRTALRAASTDLREMPRRKEKTFCCGAGGSNYWFKVPEQRSIAGIRTEEAVKTGAKEIATECPFCLSMFEDSTRVMNSGMQVRDVAEIVAEALL